MFEAQPIQIGSRSVPDAGEKDAKSGAARHRKLTEEEFDFQFDNVLDSLEQGYYVYSINIISNARVGDIIMASSPKRVENIM
ncbi:hypothetical protein MHM84_20460 [Halomonas sp. McH1-25]|uniref:hypothetical protein n=1 Tax=unclassified Halomonas TaxID=2609666 RepID=UPI001EF6D45F|nr:MULTISPECIES: hypothetical protein [unclassified Halomonas]MCG7602114.1 hypothetical protein [Halomonas sp. McH1-25]MCP1343032.1 hypothetical protein [Halomonas sp. FL8]MCP1362981.1 hypothetical protein [Halomonas sp. BBD45]MCP1364951.1 hypothetical protein [Halomonas sp. BBD48]